MKKVNKLVFISSIAVPYQVRFCDSLQEYYESRFWFYEHPDRTRGRWWRVDLGKSCEVLERVLFSDSGLLADRYLALDLKKKLEAFDPDIVLLGGLSIPSNYLAYRWAKRHKKKTILLTERSRDSRGNLRKCTATWRLLRWLYRDLDLVIVTVADAIEQFRDEFRFGDKVVEAQYAVDIDAYFEHPLRTAKESYTLFFANRMTEIYNPLGAIEIFAAMQRKYPGSRLVMNAAGELGDRCRARIAELSIEHKVRFLDDLSSWSDLPKVYASCDILILPAHFSNGNFTILEAMASGMGIIVSDKVLGIGKLIEDGRNGFSCAPTTEQFLERIESYIHQPEQFSVHASINRPLAMPYSARSTAELFHQILQERIGC
jgi:glycosyltransferase involved in cell wall biosynthesis